jgi:hypothetical protein
MGSIQEPSTQNQTDSSKKTKILLFTVGISSAIVLCGFAILVQFLQIAFLKIEMLTHEIENLHTQVQAKDKIQSQESRMDNSSYLQGIKSLAASLETTTQLLLQEKKNRKEVEESEDIAVLKPSRLPQ